MLAISQNVPNFTGTIKCIMPFPRSRRAAPLFPFEVARLLSTVEGGHVATTDSTPRIKLPYFTGFLAMQGITAWNETQEAEYAVKSDVGIPPRLIVVHAHEVFAASKAAGEIDPANKDKVLASLYYKLGRLAQPRKLGGLLKEKLRPYNIASTAMNKVAVCNGEDGKKRLMLHFGDMDDPVAVELAEERQSALEILDSEGFMPSEIRHPGILLGELTPGAAAEGFAHHAMRYVQNFLAARVKEIQEANEAEETEANPLQPFRILPATIRQEYVE